MTNKENMNPRNNSILSLAKIIKQGRQEQTNKSCDLSEFSKEELLDVGMSNLMLAIHLHDVGCQMANYTDVTVIVENGQVTRVYSNNESIAAEVIDLDVEDIEILNELRASVEKVKATQFPVW